MPYRCLLIAVLLCVTTGAAQAVNISELYQTQAVVTGTGEANRQLGFESCFRTVLVKVSGDQRVVENPAAKVALPTAGSFIADFRYRDRMEDVPIHDEQGTHDRPHDLTCVFDHARIDDFLRKLGSRPWLEERPRLVIFIAVRSAGKAFMLSRDGIEGPYMRDALNAAAETLAIRVALPDAATLSKDALTAETLPAASSSDLDAIANRYDGAAALAGSLVWSDADLGWVADWRLSNGKTEHRWQIRGVSFDDAFRNAMAGSLQIYPGNDAP